MPQIENYLKVELIKLTIDQLPVVSYLCGRVLALELPQSWV